MGKRGGIQLFDDTREEFFSICDLASQRNVLGDNFIYQYQPGGLFASVGQVGMNFGVSPNSSNSSDNNNGIIKSSYNDLYVKYVPSQDSARIVEVPEGEKTLKKKKGGLKLKIKIANPSLRRLFSGAIAGAVSRTAVAPLETIRTHLMVGSSGHSTTEVLHNIMKTDGWKGLFRGNFVNVIRVAPSKAIESTPDWWSRETRLFRRDVAEQQILTFCLKPNLKHCRRNKSPVMIDSTLKNIYSMLQHRGGRSHRRGFSDRPHNGGRGPFVSGDSHLHSVRDSNLSFRQGTFSNQTAFQPPPYNQIQQFTQPLPHNQNQQFRPPPSYNQTQWFRQPPPPFDQNRAVRPRTSKPLDYRNWEYTKEAPPPNSGG